MQLRTIEEVSILIHAILRGQEFFVPRKMLFPTTIHNRNLNVLRISADRNGVMLLVELKNGLSEMYIDEEVIHFLYRQVI